MRSVLPVLLSAVRLSPPSDGPVHGGQRLGVDEVEYVYSQVCRRNCLIWILHNCGLSVSSDSFILNCDRCWKFALQVVHDSSGESVVQRHLGRTRVARGGLLGVQRGHYKVGDLFYYFPEMKHTHQQISSRGGETCCAIQVPGLRSPRTPAFIPLWRNGSLIRLWASAFALNRFPGKCLFIIPDAK